MNKPQQASSKSIDAMQSSLLADIANALVANASPDYIQGRLGDLTGVSRKVGDRLTFVLDQGTDWKPGNEVDRAAIHFIQWARGNRSAPINKMLQDREKLPSSAAESAPDPDEEFFGN